jgi:FlaG/FlaF family flagellin (archaellin)
VIVNEAVVAPPGTVTLAGTVATEVRELVSVTEAPAAGAGPERKTVPIEGFDTAVRFGPTLR